MNDRTKVNRAPHRAVYDFDTVASILDDESTCIISFIHDGNSVAIPVSYGRKNQELFIHGSVIGRMFTSLESGIDICINVTIIDGMVLAKSAYNHSMNYRSVVIFGKAKVVEDKDKVDALKCISDQMLPGRWEEVRPPSKEELKITSVLSIPITEFSAKIRTGGPKDTSRDIGLDIWSGVIPIERKMQNPIADEYSDNISLPDSIRKRLSIK